MPVVLVSSYAHFSNKAYPAYVETVYVDSEQEAADYRIMHLLQQGDVLITQDYGLASLALGKKAIVLHHKGFQYTYENIDRLLETRYLSAQMRKSGKRTKGPNPFTKEAAEDFRAVFKQVINNQ